ncbi:MAG: DUF1254 domain-containing protein [Pseudomonadota bacterium]
MKSTTRIQITAAVCIAMLAAASVHARQIAPVRSAAELAPPVAGMAMTKEYVQMVGRMAYVWGWPLVNAQSRRAALARVPMPGLRGGVIPVAPVGHAAMLTDYVKPEETFITCPNQDVVYGGAMMALDKDAIVMQVPDFGERYWLYGMYDGRSDEFAAIGKQYGTRPGFYLVVGPHWRGTLPAGFQGLVRSSTEMAFAVPRIFKDDTAADSAAIQPALREVMFYPLSEFTGRMQSTDWSTLPTFPAPPAAPGEIKWVRPEAFAEQLPAAMKVVPPMPGEEALYAWIESVFEAAARDPALKQALNEAFAGAEKDILEPLLHWRYNGIAAGNGWNSPKNNARWGSDYLARTAVAKSSMYQNRPEETKYLFRDEDANGAPLHGNHSYAITFAKGQLPPVKGFWSLTLYNQYHLFEPNALAHYSLGTKNKSLLYNADGSLTLYAGAASPGADKESNWLPAPNGVFSLFLRGYWPGPAMLDGSWVPPTVVRLNPSN